MEFGNGQMLCFVYIGELFFVDCELLFWLNVFEVLLKVFVENNWNCIQFVVCLCIKIMYCFDGFVGSVDDVLMQFDWCVVCMDGGYVFEVSNLMLFVVNLGSVLLNVVGCKYDVGMGYVLF